MFGSARPSGSSGSIEARVDDVLRLLRALLGGARVRGGALGDVETFRVRRRHHGRRALHLHLRHRGTARVVRHLKVHSLEIILVATLAAVMVLAMVVIIVTVLAMVLVVVMVLAMVLIIVLVAVMVLIIVFVVFFSEVFGGGGVERSLARLGDAFRLRGALLRRLGDAPRRLEGRDVTLGQIVRRLGGVVLARFLHRRLRRLALGIRRGRRLLRSRVIAADAADAVANDRRALSLARRATRRAFQLGVLRRHLAAAFRAIHLLRRLVASIPSVERSLAALDRETEPNVGSVRALGTLGTLRAGSEPEGGGDARDGGETRRGATRGGDGVRRGFARRHNRRDATFDVIGGVSVGVGPGHPVEERGEGVAALGGDGVRGGAARVGVRGRRRGQPAKRAAARGAAGGGVGSAAMLVVRTIRRRARSVGAVGAVVVTVVVIVGSVGAVVVAAVVIVGRSVGTMMTASAAASAGGPAAVVVMTRGAGGARRADEDEGDETEGEVLPACGGGRGRGRAMSRGTVMIVVYVNSPGV